MNKYVEKKKERSVERVKKKKKEREKACITSTRSNILFDNALICQQGVSKRKKERGLVIVSKIEIFTPNIKVASACRGPEKQN